MRDANFVYLNNRHYDPTTGVFISVDPLVTMTGEPYVYGGAKPVTYSDPSGLCIVPSTLQYEYERDDDGNIVGVTVSGTRMRGPECDPTDREGGNDDDGYDFDNPGGWGSDEEWEQYGEKHEIVWHYSRTDSALGFQVAGCFFVCLSGGILWDDGPHRVFSFGEAGFGISASTIAVPVGSACGQQGWGWGADVSYGYAAVGVSVGADPLPNDSGHFWDPDFGTTQVRAGVSGGLRVSGGPSYTWVSGC